MLQVAGGAARFTFFQLCKALLGAADYQVLRVPLAARELLLETMHHLTINCDHDFGARLQQILTGSRVVSAGYRAALPHHFRDRRPVAVTCGTWFANYVLCWNKATHAGSLESRCDVIDASPEDSCHIKAHRLWLC